MPSCRRWAASRRPSTPPGDCPRAVPWHRPSRRARPPRAGKARSRTGPRQGLRGRSRVERDLHALPVALVQVVELVEVVVEPVLHGQLEDVRLARDVGTGHRRRPPGPPDGREVPRVRAGRIQRVARQIDVVVAALSDQIGRGGSAGDQLHTAASQPQQPDPKIAEHRIHRRRGPLLLFGGVTEAVLLCPRHHDRRVLVDQPLRGAGGLLEFTPLTTTMCWHRPRDVRYQGVSCGRARCRPCQPGDTLSPAAM